MGGGLEALLPASGVAGVLVVVIAYLLTANRVDRREYQEAVAVEQRRYAEEVGRHERTQQLLDEEREARRAAEDVAGRAVAAAERVNEELVRLRDEIKRLEHQVHELSGRVQSGHRADAA